EVRAYLRRAETHLSKAILTAPYAATEAIASDMDKVAALKFSLYAERAEVRFRLGAHRQAAADVAMALHCVDALEEAIDIAIDIDAVKVLAVRCFAALRLLDGDGQAEELIDYITLSKSYSSSGNNSSGKSNKSKDKG